MTRIAARGLLVLTVSASSAVTVMAMRHTSATFDEIVLIAGGARGYQTGRFDLNPDHPPLMQYIYGLPVFLSEAGYPDDSDAPSVERQTGYGYIYANRMLFGSGNDPERLTFLGRLPAAGFVALLVLVTYAFVRRAYGTSPALLAAAMVGFLPDVLAHGGVAYNDVPLALVILGGLWAIDAVVRDPSPVRAAGAGLLAGIAICVKVSAGMLVPAAIILLGMEAARWRADRAAWLKRCALALPVAVIAAYLAVVAVYRGDFLLEQYRTALAFRMQHLSGGHNAYTVLLGHKSQAGWWFFYPVAFFLKTSAGLHVLMVIGAYALIAAARRTPRALLASPLRAPAVGAALFGAALLASNLYIGFRYALPLLPLLCIVTAVGVVRFWANAPRRLRAVIVAATIWMVAFPLSYYPHFLTYISEYGPARDRNYRILTDSSMDWGQGLLGLRDFMRERGIPRVYLSYFGSARPEGYGIDYVPLRSFFTLPPAAVAEPEPEHIVVSATNLIGSYFGDDPFAALRELEPDHVIGNSMFVFRLPPQDRAAATPRSGAAGAANARYAGHGR